MTGNDNDDEDGAVQETHGGDVGDVPPTKTYAGGQYKGHSHRQRCSQRKRRLSTACLYGAAIPMLLGRYSVIC